MTQSQQLLVAYSHYKKRHGWLKLMAAIQRLPVAVQDLTECLAHTNLASDFALRFGQAMQDRLLHAGQYLKHPLATQSSKVLAVRRLETWLQRLHDMTIEFHAHAQNVHLTHACKSSGHTACCCECRILWLDKALGCCLRLNVFASTRAHTPLKSSCASVIKVCIESVTSKCSFLPNFVQKTIRSSHTEVSQRFAMMSHTPGACALQVRRLWTFCSSTFRQYGLSRPWIHQGGWWKLWEHLSRCTDHVVITLQSDWESHQSDALETACSSSVFLQAS